MSEDTISRLAAGYKLASPLFNIAEANARKPKGFSTYKFTREIFNQQEKSRFAPARPKSFSQWARYSSQPRLAPAPADSARPFEKFPGRAQLNESQDKFWAGRDGLKFKLLEETVNLR